MEYTIEIEEAERTLEFTLDVNIWEEPICECGRIEFDIESVKATYDNGLSFSYPSGSNRYKNLYTRQIENMLEEDEKLFEAWQEHVESV